mmetsp:Transcript_40391/g.51998  ORF Transcript_40391/g.51998 Transcript_40391/m.51998 type:complete len:479 (+) Transcript_40391:4079-5515(+)
MSLPRTASPGLKSSSTTTNGTSGSGSGGASSNNGGDPNMEHLFQDSSLTERERELIYRAYLAGIAQSGATPPSSGSPTNASSSNNGAGTGTNSNMKIKFKKEKGSKAKNSSNFGRSTVQWDFNSDSHGNGQSSGSSSIPDGFLHEYGIEFPDDVEHLSGERRVADSLDDDLELSSSLLTMSLDKDIPIDEMALSAGERLMLTKPMAEDAMASLGHGGGLHLSHSPSNSNNGSGRNNRRSGNGRKNNGSSNSRRSKQSDHSNSNSSNNASSLSSNSMTDLDNLSSPNGKNRSHKTKNSSSSTSSSSPKNSGHRTRQSTSGLSQSTLDNLLLPGLETTGSMPLDQQQNILIVNETMSNNSNNNNNVHHSSSSSSTNHQMNHSSLIGEQQKAEVRREILFAQNLENSQNLLETQKSTISPNLYGLDLFDPSSSTELANSGDLVDLVNSPNLWISNSLSFSSISPTNSNNENNNKDTGLPVV